MTYCSRMLAVLTCLLVAVTSTASAEQPKPFAGVAAPPPAVHGFSVALVLGSMQGAATPDNLPNGAKKALADMRDFLPYKSYRLLDTQWILCCGTSKVGTGVSGRLRGVSHIQGGDEPEYSFTVTLVGVSGSQLSVRFLMTDGGNSLLKKHPAPKAPVEAPSYKERDRDNELERKLKDKERENELERKIKGVEREFEEALRAAGGSKGAIIDSTFSMEIGETVVIGTSSLKGDRALIAVLTAAKRPPQQLSTLGK